MIENEDERYLDLPRNGDLLAEPLRLSDLLAKIRPVEPPKQAEELMESDCARCRQKMVFSELPKYPTPGDFTICYSCGLMSKFGVDLALVPLNAKERAAAMTVPEVRNARRRIEREQGKR